MLVHSDTRIYTYFDRAKCDRGTTCLFGCGLLRGAPVAKWYRIWLLTRGLWVRVPPGAVALFFLLKLLTRICGHLFFFGAIVTETIYLHFNLLNKKLYSFCAQIYFGQVEDPRKFKLGPFIVSFSQVVSTLDTSQVGLAGITNSSHQWSPLNSVTPSSAL